VEFTSSLHFVRRAREKDLTPVLLASTGWFGEVSKDGEAYGTTHIKDGFEEFKHLCGFMLAFCTMAKPEDWKDKDKEALTSATNEENQILM